MSGHPGHPLDPPLDPYVALGHGRVYQRAGSVNAVIRGRSMQTIIVLRVFLREIFVLVWLYSRTKTAMSEDFILLPTVAHTDTRPKECRVYRCRQRLVRLYFLPRDAMLAPVYAVVPCPSVRRSSVTSRYCIETTGRIELVFGVGLPSTYPTLCSKEIWLSPKIRVLPSGTLSQTPDLENFATASRSRCQ